MVKELDNNKSKVPEEKHPGGRPALFETPEDLQAKIDHFFEKIEKERLTNPNRIPGLAELAYELGFESRQSLYDYEKRGDKFSYTIKRAKLFIITQYEQKLTEEKANPMKWCYFLNSYKYQQDKSDSKSRRIGGNVIIITTDKKPKDLSVDGQEVWANEDQD